MKIFSKLALRIQGAQFQSADCWVSQNSSLKVKSMEHDQNPCIRSMLISTEGMVPFDTSYGIS